MGKRVPEPISLERTVNGQEALFDVIRGLDILCVDYEIRTQEPDHEWIVAIKVYRYEWAD